MPNKVQALALSTHPGPTVAVAVIGVVLGVGIGLEPGRLLLVGLAIVANQVSIGMSNDWIDAGRDRAVGRTDKPVVRGWVSEADLRTGAWIAAALSVIITVPLGPGALFANAAFIASGWTYNAWLKNTPFSVVPYIVGFGSLPLIVTQSLPSPSGAAWWAIAAGALLGIAAHFANVLPDLDDDRRTGISGLPHRLGRKLAGVTTYAVLAAASALVVFGSGREPTVLAWACLMLSAALAAWGVVLVATRPPTRILFRLIIAAAVLNVVLLAFSGDLLLA